MIGQQSFSLFFLLTEMKINPIKLRSSSRLDKFTSSMIGLNKKKAFFFLKRKKSKVEITWENSSLQRLSTFPHFLEQSVFTYTRFLLVERTRQIIGGDVINSG